MELIDEKELFSYIVDNSEREGHFDYYQDRRKTWNCVWLQEGKFRLMLPSTIELYTNLNELWKDNDIKLGWSGLTLLTTYLLGSIWKLTQKIMLLFKQLENTFDFLTKALMRDKIVHPNDRSENNSTKRRNPQTLVEYLDKCFVSLKKPWQI